MITGPEAGITRDAIAVELDWEGRSLTAVRHRGAQAQDADGGQGRGVFGRRHLEGDPLRRGRRAGARRRTSLREAGPADRRSHRAGGPGARHRREQMGPCARTAGEARRAEGDLRAPAGANQGRCRSSRSRRLPARASTRSCAPCSPPMCCGTGGCPPMRSINGCARPSKRIRLLPYRAGASSSDTSRRAMRALRPSCCSARGRRLCRTPMCAIWSTALRETFDLKGVPIRLHLRKGEQSLRHEGNDRR